MRATTKLKGRPNAVQFPARAPEGRRPPEAMVPVPSLPRFSYIKALTLAFTTFNALRLVAYLPTMLTIWHTGQSDQHSLLTWLNWMGANATMAAWLYEHNGRRLDRTVLINISNSAMCALTVALIAWFRL